jgi:gp16 family phage-associated protein
MDDISPEQIQQVKAQLRAKGITLTKLCQENEVSYQAARDLLSGKRKGWRGECHRAAVLLGLKPDPEKLAA